MPSVNSGPAASQTTNLSANLSAPGVTALQLSGALTVAQLPTTGLTFGASAYTSDQGAVRWNGSAWVPGVTYASASAVAQRRAANIAAFTGGALIAAPAWAATTAYAVNQSVTLPTGDVVACQTAGTSAGTAPAYSPSNPFGRPLTDGTVTWGGVPQGNSGSGYWPSNTLIPASVTQYNTAAAAGLTETIICTGTGNATLNKNVTMLGALAAPGSGYQNTLAAFAFACANATGGGNATGGAVAQGYSAANGYQCTAYDVEFYITDTVVALTFTNNINQPVSIEVDGVNVVANPVLTNGNTGCCIVIDYAGIAKRRRVTWNGPGVANTLRGYALSTTGFAEPSDTPNYGDNMLFLTDSIGGTVASDFPANPNVICIGALIKRYLGLGSVVTCSAAGAGYYAANVNTYNQLQMVQNSANQQIWPQYNPSHILVALGFNDRANSWSLVEPNALATWQQLRALFPKAKITITDGFSQASGPDANALAQAANFQALFNSWGDTNSRFIQSTSTSSSTAWVQGTAISTTAIGAGNSCWVVGSGGTHSTGVGADYQAKRMANAIIQAWNGAY